MSACRRFCSASGVNAANLSFDGAPTLRFEDSVPGQPPRIGAVDVRPLLH